MWSLIRDEGYRLVSSLCSVVYPSTCPVCKKPSDVFLTAPICLSCWGKIEKYSGPSCRICAVPLTSEHSKLCGECLRETPPFSIVVNYGLYSGTLSEAIHLLKFSGLKRIARPLGKLLLGLHVPSVDAIVPVPVSAGTLRARGFNQTLLLAGMLSKHFKIPVKMDLLRKKRETLPQIGLGARERVKNLRNAFEAKGSPHKMHLLLVDDVMTTGATVRECSKTLLKAGAEKVTVVTLARSFLD